MTAVLLTGATGFVGRHLLARLLERPDVSLVRCLSHRGTPELGDPRIQLFRGDLGDRPSLAGITDGIDVVIHLAGHVGEDDEACHRINAVGTEALCEMLRRPGRGRFTYLSNAAVYGWATHAGANEQAVVVEPATPTSRSRAAAERHVLAVGGRVVRPLFVYGDGDTRFMPLLSRALSRSPVMVGGGRAKVSVIAVEDLARALVELALEHDHIEQNVFHATDQRPVSLRELAETLNRRDGARIPRWSLPYPAARLLLRLRGGSVLGAKTWSTTAEHRLFLVSRDHWYDSSRLWQLLGWRPTSSMVDWLSSGPDS